MRRPIESIDANCLPAAFRSPTLPTTDAFVYRITTIEKRASSDSFGISLSLSLALFLSLLLPIYPSLDWRRREQTPFAV